jgi:hypothetical protein
LIINNSKPQPDAAKNHTYFLPVRMELRIGKANFLFPANSQTLPHAYSGDAN